MNSAGEEPTETVTATGILVVEDESVTGRVVQALLGQMGVARVRVVPSGEQALAELESFAPDLVLMDIQLQGRMNGIEAAQRMSDRMDVPIIFMTAHAEEDLVRLARAARPYGYVLKPFDERTLRIAVEIGMARAREHRALKASEARFRSLVEVTSDWIWEIDTEDRYTYASPKVRDLLGYEPEGVLGRRPFDFMPPEEAEAVGRAFRPLKEARASFCQLPNTNRRRDGSLVVVETSAVPVLDPAGAFRGYRGIDRDVTERTRAEERIVRAKKEWEGTFDVVPDGIMIVDERYRILRVNRAMAERLGLTVQEAVGRLCYRCVHGTEGPPEHCLHRQVLADGRQRIWEFHEGFLSRRFLASSSLLQPEGQERKVVHILGDISEKKRLEKEIIEAEDRERNRIGQDLHDELGQRLTGVSFLCKTLEMRLEEQGRPEAAEMRKIETHVNEAILNTRELASGMRCVKPVAEGLQSALQDLACRLEEQFGIDCLFVCEQEVPVHANAVATHLYRIVQEAVHNAVKHGGARRVEVVLSRMNGTLYLSVECDGKAFDGRKDATEGLGLKIMRYRANMIGAMLWIEKRTGGGHILTVKWNEKSLEER